MCNYCEKNTTIMDRDFVDSFAIEWGAEINGENATYSTWVIFIDRGYIRFVPRDDSQCMDHGHKFKINYCPVCGKKMEDII